MKYIHQIAHTICKSSTLKFFFYSHSLRYSRILTRFNILDASMEKLQIMYIQIFVCLHDIFLCQKFLLLAFLHQ